MRHVLEPREEWPWGEERLLSWMSCPPCSLALCDMEDSRCLPVCSADTGAVCECQGRLSPTHRLASRSREAWEKARVRDQTHPENCSQLWQWTTAATDNGGVISQIIIAYASATWSLTLMVYSMLSEFLQKINSWMLIIITLMMTVLLLVGLLPPLLLIGYYYYYNNRPNNNNLILSVSLLDPCKGWRDAELNT